MSDDDLGGVSVAGEIGDRVAKVVALVDRWHGRGRARCPYCDAAPGAGDRGWCPNDPDEVHRHGTEQ